jgi:hypothetical protein
MLWKIVRGLAALVVLAIVAMPAGESAATEHITILKTVPPAAQRPSLESFFPDLEKPPAPSVREQVELLATKQTTVGDQASWQSNFLGLGLPVGQVIGGLALLAGYGVGLLIIKMVPFLFVVGVVGLAVLFVRRRWNTV